MGLKVFNLQCDQGHLFEGWFRSHEDYDNQQARGLIECPVCQSGSVQKMLSAPRLNMGRAQMPEQTQQGGSADSVAAPVIAGSSGELATLQAAVLQQFRALVRSSEDVGVRFAEEARLIHEGQADVRPIRGIATAEEREQLAEEGIAVMALPEFLDDDRLN